MRRRAVLLDILGLAFLLFVLLDYVRPSLLLLPTIAAGGDTPCHYPTFVYFYERLLPHGRIHGWYPGAYLGHPLLLYYFPLPFWVMSAFAPFTGLPVAFKLGSVLGVFLLPLCAFVSFRLMGFRSPGPLLGAGAALVFLLLEENPIWGGTLASTLTGEFAYTYGIGFALLFLGGVRWAHRRGAGPWLPGAILALTAFAHGYAVLWAGLSATYLLYSSRRPLRTVLWLGAIAGIAFALVAVWLLPLLADWGSTTPFNDPWITIELLNLLPTYLWPLMALTLLGLLLPWLLPGRSRVPDGRVLFLLHAALIAAALAAAAPVLGVIDVRFVPFAQAALCLAGAAGLALFLEEWSAPHLAGLGFVMVMAVYADGQSRVLRTWVDWNYSGLEAKERWPAFRALNRHLAGGVADPRVAVEYSTEHEKAGSIRIYETVPFFSGRSTLEGVYNQASLMTHAVYYVSSELGERSPNPFRRRGYSGFDLENGLRHLLMLNVRDVVAVSGMLTSALAARSDVERVWATGPYAVFRLKDASPGYVEPLHFAPVRASPRGWRERAYRWFSFKPQSPVPLVFTDDARFGPVWTDPYLPPPAQPLPGGVEVEEQVDVESVRIRTSRPGHPLLVKISFHPRWRATGADGPYLVSPGLMLVVPREREVVLRYSRGLSDALGGLMSLGALIGIGVVVWRRIRRTSTPVSLDDRLSAADLDHRGLHAAAAVPVALLAILLAARMMAHAPDRTAEVRDLFEHARAAFAVGRYPEAAELARHALLWGAAGPHASELRVLRGESLLRAGKPLDAMGEFDLVVVGGQHGDLQARALYGLMKARRASGDATTAAVTRRRLLEQYAGTPWALQAESEPR